jgi:hypothetical protein
LQQIARAGLVRIPDISRGGHLVCITPKGTEHLQRANRAPYEESGRSPALTWYLKLGPLHLAGGGASQRPARGSWGGAKRDAGESHARGNKQPLTHARPYAPCRRRRLTCGNF